MKNTFITAFGSNLGNRQYHIEEAIKTIKAQKFKLLGLSRLYKTEAWPNNSRPWYLNAAALWQSGEPLKPLGLITTLLQIESTLGRLRDDDIQDRIIDIDLIFVGDQISTQTECIIPHPGFQDRSFVLEPLLDICPLFHDPRNQIKLIDLQRQCCDSSKICLY